MAPSARATRAPDGTAFLCVVQDVRSFAVSRGQRRNDAEYEGQTSCVPPRKGVLSPPPPPARRRAQSLRIRLGAIPGPALDAPAAARPEDDTSARPRAAVLRRALINRWNDLQERTAVLVTAPRGFGKTTLLCSGGAPGWSGAPSSPG